MRTCLDCGCRCALVKPSFLSNDMFTFLSLFIHSIWTWAWDKEAWATATFLSLAFFPFEFWWNWSFYIFSCCRYRLLAFNAKLFLLLLIDSASERKKKPQKFSVLSFINQHGLIHLDRISWKPNDIVRANKLKLYFIQKTIWP